MNYISLLILKFFNRFEDISEAVVHEVEGLV